jgi:hypothetical protein
MASSRAIFPDFKKASGKISLKNIISKPWKLNKKERKMIQGNKWRKK